MFSLAKNIQFARLAGLIMSGEQENEPEYIGTKEQWREFRELQAKDDRGEFTRYPWQPIEF